MTTMDSRPAAKMHALLTPRWIITTILVIAAVAGMARLGFWQLERLEERRAFNTRVLAQVNAPELSLNGALSFENLTGEQLIQMEYRPVVVTGIYDPEQEILLRNQVHENMPGYHLLTPLIINGTDTAILVNRGFVPLAASDPGALDKYLQPRRVTVRGILRLPHVPRVFGVPDPTLVPGQDRLDIWNAVNIERIQTQLPYAVLPVYIQAAPDQGDLPAASLDQPDLTEGSHLSYAGQWFSFAALLALGYPLFLRRQMVNIERKSPKRARL